MGRAKLIAKYAEKQPVPGDLVFEVIATHSGYWGKGESLEAAKANCIKAGSPSRGKFAFAIVPKGATLINDGMNVEYPAGYTFSVTRLGLV